MVIWIIGLSGSGKSFYAKEIKKKISNSIIVDGDEVRKYITTKLGYSSKDRKENSLMIIKLCSFLESKGFNVICPILSIFPQHQKKNRKIFKKYMQIFLNANMGNLKTKSKNQVYNLKRNVVGKDISFPKPYKSDLIFQNYYNKKINFFLKKIIKRVNEKN